jgi:MSHA biogenesis protein MshP
MAIFIIVVLAGLGSFMAVFSTSEQVGSALDVNGTQASFAARGGVEWAASQAINSATPPCATGAGTTTNFTISGFTVSVNCITSSANEAGMTGLFAISVTACKPASGGACPGELGNPNYVERSLFTLIEK